MLDGSLKLIALVVINFGVDARFLRDAGMRKCYVMVSDPLSIVNCSKMPRVYQNITVITVRQKMINICSL